MRLRSTGWKSATGQVQKRTSSHIDLAMYVTRSSVRLQPPLILVLIFQVQLPKLYHRLYENLTYGLRPAAIALNYSVKKHTERRNAC